MQKCADCGKLVKSNHPNARVFHMACAMAALAERRAKTKKFKPWKKWEK